MPWIDSLFQRESLPVLETALSFRGQKQHTILNNIANVETPGFRARQVSFEQALSEAMASGDPRRAGITTTRSTAPGRIDGSNVDLDDEMRSLELNSLQQQLLTSAINSRYTRLRTAIGRT